MALPASLPLEEVDTPPIARGATLARIHWPSTVEPFFGPEPGLPPKYRFDDPQGKFRVCYLGIDETASFAETFLHTPRPRIITLEALGKRKLSFFRVTRELRLLQLHGGCLTQVGCTAQITSSPKPYDDPQLFGREVWEHSDKVDGIQWRCRHDNGLFAVGLFDRAATALKLVNTEDLLNDRNRLLKWRNRYGFEPA